ncbi:hypothetical protein ATANTOWER_022538 [Ataeniobius toweri]|uniref:Ig-like domain-containing protein n=1 Tax=Ataeniobius toweri TaxID=208326 RepID=A0ABU7B819_9TELE|nr:hypothetical protein [Ataeniobius toweri]
MQKTLNCCHLHNNTRTMKADWIMTIFMSFTTMSGFVPAAEVQHVHFGSTIILGCNISYLYETAWFKQNPDLIPNVVLYATLKEGRPFECRVEFLILIQRQRSDILLTVQVKH